jgi:pilus assembly protein CpaE
MNLFSGAKTGAMTEKVVQRSKKNDSRKSVVIMSARAHILSEISSYLRMNNIKNIVELEADLFTTPSVDGLDSAENVIVDIGASSDIRKIGEHITVLVSVQSHILIVGDNDSIAFAQQLMRDIRLPYLHIGSQLTQLMGGIEGKAAMRASSPSVKISVLGCKGGAGTTTVANRLFHYVGMLTRIPVLLIQGASGSRDLDLLLGKTLPSDGASLPISEHLSVIQEPHGSMWNYNDIRFEQYNLIFFDHMLHYQPIEQLEMVISMSNTIVLVITRELSSIRTAKKILDENLRIENSRPGRVARILICLNENHPPTGNELKNIDIKEYLGCEELIVNPYNPNQKESDTNSPLYHLAALLTGKDIIETPTLTNIFGRLRRKLK